MARGDVLLIGFPNSEKTRAKLTPPGGSRTGRCREPANSGGHACYLTSKSTPLSFRGKDRTIT
jgi:hypothetical protein